MRYNRIQPADDKVKGPLRYVKKQGHRKTFDQYRLSFIRLGLDLGVFAQSPHLGRRDIRQPPNHFDNRTATGRPFG